jgi:hypothetical protein
MQLYGDTVMPLYGYEVNPFNVPIGYTTEQIQNSELAQTNFSFR